MSKKLDHAQVRQQRQAEQTDRAEEQLVRDFTRAAAKPLRGRGRRKPVRSAWDPEPRWK